MQIFVGALNGKTAKQLVLWACLVHAAPDRFLATSAPPPTPNVTAGRLASAEGAGNSTTVVALAQSAPPPTSNVTEGRPASAEGAGNSTSVEAQATLQWSYPVNLCLPPHAYASIAALGWADGFTGKGYTIENILGSSGGAASGLLILADPNLRSDLGRRVYQKASHDFWTETDDYTYWARVYEKILMADASAFSRVRSGSKVALKCWDKGGSGNLVVLYNFRTPKQAAQAHAAAGDPGCHLSNWPVEGVWGYTANCADAGGAQVDAGFKTGQAVGSKIYYYDTSYLLQEGFGAIGFITELIKKGRSDYANFYLHSKAYGPAKSDTGYAWINMN